MSFEYWPVSYGTGHGTIFPFAMLSNDVMTFGAVNLGEQMFHFTKKLSVTLHYNFRLLFRINLQILWYQFWNTFVHFTKKYRISSLFSKMSTCHSCANGGHSVREHIHQTATKLHKTERFFQKCVQLYLNYKLSINFVTRCLLLEEKT